jgi:hypothetical protein
LLIGLLSGSVALLGQQLANSGETGVAAVGKLIAEAKAADTSEGSYKYARRVTEWLVPHQTGNAYRDAFAGRLSKADLMARHHERKWIPESLIAKAYNDLVKKIRRRSGNPPSANVSVVHQLRITSSEVSPALSTVNSQSSECLPTEAVQLMYQLLQHNGTVEGPCPPTPGPNGTPVQHQCPYDDDAWILMLEFSRTHSASQQQKLLDQTAKLFGL